MPSKKSIFFVFAIVTGVGYFLLNKFDIQSLEQLQLLQGSGSTHPIAERGPLPVKRSGETIRIASFNIQVFGQSKLSKSHVMDRLAQLARNFDVVAIQEIRARSDDILPRYVELINAGGRHYDYVIGPRLGRSKSTEQYAFVFDRESIEVARDQLYTVEDPDDLLHREPLVAWFRVRGPSANEAFTFTLANIHTDPDEVDLELDILDDVYWAVRNDGLGEDDVIILGDFNVDDRHLGQLGAIADITWAISGVPTNTRGTKSYDNLVFHRGGTTEFTGNSGVVDFMRQFNLTAEEALEISDHLPVWAEFSIYEGGEPGRVATRPGSAGN